MQASLQNTSSENYYFVLVILIFFFIMALVQTFQKLKTYRALQYTPRSKIRSAAQGFVELQGIQEAQSKQTLLSPITFTPCTSYYYRIEKWVKRSDTGGSWETCFEESTSTPFLMHDETGYCWIFPKNAEIVSADETVKYSFSRIPWYLNHNPAASKTRWTRFWEVFTDIVLSLFIKQYRHREQMLKPGDPFYGCGYFETHYDLSNTRFSELLREANTSLNQKLEPFSINTADFSEETIINTLSKGPKNNATHTFLIANLPEKKVSSHTRWQIGFLLLTDLILLGCLVYFLGF